MSYIHGEWNHIFADLGQRTVRFVYDVREEKLLAAHLKRLPSEKVSWKPLNELQLADLADSLHHGNEEVFDVPVDYGLELSDNLPGWASFA
jgi:hypothetical protein